MMVSTTCGRCLDPRVPRVALVLFVLLASLLIDLDCRGSEALNSVPEQTLMKELPGMAIPVGETRIIPVSGVTRAAVGDPSIVDIVVIGPDLILANAKTPGKTSLHLWTDSGIGFLTVTSYRDLSEVVDQATDLIGTDAVRLTPAGSSVILEGCVESEEQRKRVVKIASAYFGDVVDLLSTPDAEAHLPEQPNRMGDQVGPEETPVQGGLDGGTLAVPEIRLAEALSSILGEEHVDARFFGDKLVIEGYVEDQNALHRLDSLASAYWDDTVQIVDMSNPVQVLIRTLVVEVDRSDASEAGVVLGTIDRTGELLPWTAILENTVGDTWRLFGGYLPAAKLRAREDVSGMRILAAPSLLTLSGEPASFLAGGEIPIYLGSNDGRVLFEWREYGVRLDIVPTVDRLGLIHLVIEPEVSELDLDRGLKVGDYTIPALTTRRVKTSVVVRDGQTIAIGGLLNTTVTKVVEKLPILSDLPVVGALFRSTEFQRGETELMIFITPEVSTVDTPVEADSLLAPNMEEVPHSLWPEPVQ